MTTHDACALCGLPLTHGERRLSVGGRTLSFCCIGCRQVYTILTEAGTNGDFTDSDLYRECVSIGIIPKTRADLDRIAAAAVAAPGGDSAPPSDAGDVLPLSLDIEGMWCPACAWVIQHAATRVPGVVEATCHFSSDRLFCRYDPRQCRPADVMAALDRLGYRTALPGENQASGRYRRTFVRFAVSALLTMNVMMLSAALYTGFVTALDADSVFKISLPMFLLTAAVFGYGGAPIFRRAAAGLSTAAFGMETLIAVAATSAFAYSTVNMLRGSIHLYFDTCAMLITLVLLGQILEARAKAAVHNDLGAFSALVPAKVRRCTPDHPEGQYAPAGALAKGDLFRLTPGESAVADGVVVDGSGTMDESTLTGEPRPIPKGPGDRVISGGTLVAGDCRVRAFQVGAETALMQMIRIMEAALAGRDASVRRTDRWLRWFVPVIVALAAATAVVVMAIGMGTEAAMVRAVTVLVIACPCALGVAVPLARVAGVSMAARQGILVRRFEAFEAAGGISAVVMDKTGTVTTGRWRLQAVTPAPGIDPSAALAAAAALETGSGHPIAEEIRRSARRQRLPIPDARDVSMTGNGVSGRVTGVTVAVGNAAFTGVDAEAAVDRTPASEEDVTSRVFLTVDGQWAATLNFGDRIRPEMSQTMAGLAGSGMTVTLLSGDDAAATRRVAERIGIQSAEGALSPQDKARRVGEIQDGGAAVAMVGDGINDAAALAVADLAVSIFSGNALDAEVADVSLMRAHPGQLGDFLDIAAAVRRNIRQNLSLSFVYNATAVPVAMMGLLTPVMAVIAMLLSSLSVIVNTLRMMRQAADKRRLAA